MRKILTILLLILSLTAYSTKYYIDPAGNDVTGNGSSSTPWASLYKAVNTATTAGDTIYVNAGTYSEANSCTLRVGVYLHGAGVTSIINFTYDHADVSDGALYVGSASSSTNGNQTISHLKLTGTDSTAWGGIAVKYRSNVKIHDVTFEDFRGMAVGFYGDYATAYETGNEIYDCIITDCNSRDFYGSALYTRGQSGLKVYDNVFTATGRTQGNNGNLFSGWGTYNKGMEIYRNKFYKPLTEWAGDWNFAMEFGETYGGNQLYDNEFYNCTVDIASEENLKGDYDYAWYIHNNVFRMDRQIAQAEDDKIAIALNLEASCQDFIVTRNLIINYPVGIAHEVDQDNRTQKNIDVYANVLYNIGYTDDMGWPVRITVSATTDAVLTDINYYNNTMVGNGAETGFFIASTDTIGGIRITNNIITGMGDNGWMEVWNTATVGAIDSMYAKNNIIYDCGNSNNVWSNRAYTLVESGEINQDPLFISTSDHHLQSTSPAINAGLDVSSVTGGMDFHGASLYGAAYDIGAFEYGVGRLVTVGTTIPTINYKLVLIDH